MKAFLISFLNILFFTILSCFLQISCTGPPPEIPPGPREVQLGHDNYIRNVTYHVPKKLRKRRRSLVLCLHGGNETPESFGRITRRGFNKLSEYNNFIVAYPEALNNFWNDAREDSVSLSHYDNIDDVGFIEKVVDYAIDSFSIDPARIFVAGLSDGGLMAMRLACEIPVRFKGFATVAASLSLDQLVECKADTAISLIAINGTRDPILPYDGGQIIVDDELKGSVLPIEDAIEFWLKESQCENKSVARDIPNTDTYDETRSERISYTNCKYGNKIVLVRVNNGGHTWPGGRQYEVQRNIGKTSKDFDASEEIWKFFKSL
ncbi:MAG: hypothetical protein MI975_16120 [Cytophagales bacterium]|nr:hypothetical protein [Cytophagales bacterium]